MYVKNDEMDPPKKDSTDRQGLGPGLVLEPGLGLGSSEVLARVWIAAWPVSVSRQRIVRVICN